MFYTYIFESKEGFRCVGVTKNVALKLKQHTEKTSIWTTRGTKWKAIYVEEFSDETAALKQEEFLKTSSGKHYISNLLESSNS